MLIHDNAPTSSSTFLPHSPSAEHLVTETSCYRLTHIISDGRALMKKSVRHDCSTDAALRASLRKEYETGRVVSQKTPFVANYISFADTPEECYVLMDYIEGDTLDKFITRNPDFFRNEDNLRRFLSQLLSGIDAIHQSQAVHLDLKPSNIIMTRVNSDVRIIDLGMCYSDIWPAAIGTTRDYAAPELLTLSDGIDSRADLYSAGKIVLYIQQRLSSQGTPFKPSRSIRNFTKRCLKDDKQERWQSAAEAIAALQPHKLSWQFFTVTLAAVAAVLLVLLLIDRQDSAPQVFTGNCSVTYEVISEDSATCRVKRLDPSATVKNVYIHSHASCNNKQYRVVEIGDSAFISAKIETVTLPSTLRHIGVAAFLNCKRLLFIDLPDNVQTIGHTAFWGCTAARRLRLSKSLKEIPDECFSQIPVTDLYVPEGVKVIGFDAFGLCGRLENVSLPQSLETIERGVFWKCKSLRKIDIPAGVKEIGTLAFHGCQSLTDVYNHSPMPQNVISIFDRTDINIHVPKDAVTSYRNSMAWRGCKIIGM